MEIRPVIDFTEYKEKDAANMIQAAAFALALLAATQEIQACLFAQTDVDENGSLVIRDSKLMQHIYKAFSARDILEMISCFHANGKQLLIFRDQLKRLLKEDGKLTMELLDEPCSFKEVTSNYRYSKDTFYNEILSEILNGIKADQAAGGGE